MFTPATRQFDVESHRRCLMHEAQRERLARLASQQRTGLNVLDNILSGMGDLLISLGRRLKKRYPGEPASHWPLPVSTQTETRIIKI